MYTNGYSGGFIAIADGSGHNNGTHDLLFPAPSSSCTTGVCCGMTRRTSSPCDSRSSGSFGEFSGQGLRTLGVACRDKGSETGIYKGHGSGMTFLGLLVLDDPHRAGIGRTLEKLFDLGIATKIIAGDNRLVAAHVTGQAARGVTVRRFRISRALFSKTRSVELMSRNGTAHLEEKPST